MEFLELPEFTEFFQKFLLQPLASPLPHKIKKQKTKEWKGSLPHITRILQATEESGLSDHCNH
jgi:hypothetical protein